MRYCYNCHRITTGEPLFCQFCGRTYDVKLCPRLHPNPRAAEVCSQCGSQDLTTPQPRVPWWSAPLLWLLTILPGFVLWVVTVLFLFGFLYVLVSNQQFLFLAMLVGLLLALLWYFYMQLPGALRKAISGLWRKSSKHDKHD